MEIFISSNLLQKVQPYRDAQSVPAKYEFALGNEPGHNHGKQ